MNEDLKDRCTSLESLLSNMSNHSKKKRFCLLTELCDDHKCTNDSISKEESSILETSNILFGSPATFAGTDFLFERHVFSTPTCSYAANNKNKTPRNLILDSCEESWCQEMATPANNEPIPTLFSSLLPAVDLSDSSTDDISLIDATDVCSDKETRKLKGVSNRTEAPRRLFHDEHTEMSSRLIPTCINENTRDNINNNTSNPLSSGINTSTTAHLDCSTSVSSLDVLFMSNSELDQLEEMEGQIEKGGGNEERQMEEIEQQIEGGNGRVEEQIDKRKEEEVSNDTGGRISNVSHGTELVKIVDVCGESSCSKFIVKPPEPSERFPAVKFTYPTSSQIKRSSDHLSCLDSKRTRSYLRPHSSFVNTGSPPSLKKAKLIASTPIRHNRSLKMAAHTVPQCTSRLPSACKSGCSPLLQKSSSKLVHSKQNIVFDVTDKRCLPQSKHKHHAGGGDAAVTTNARVEDKHSVGFSLRHRLNETDKNEESSPIPVELNWEEFNTFTQLPAEERITNTMDDGKNRGHRDSTDTLEDCCVDISDRLDISETADLLSTTTLNTLLNDSESNQVLYSPDMINARSYTNNSVIEDAPLHTSGNTNTSSTTINSEKLKGTLTKSLEPVQPKRVRACLTNDKLSMRYDDEKSVNGSSLAAATGFTTASGKSISVSEEAVHSMRNLLCEDDSEISNPLACDIVTDNNNQVFQPVELLSVLDRDSLDAICVSNTACGKCEEASNTKFLSIVRVTTPEETLCSVSDKTFEVIQDSIHDEYVNSDSSNVDFLTDKGNGVSLGEDSAETNKKSINQEKKRTCTVGFSTASGKPVSVSKKALQTVKGLIDKIDQYSHQSYTTGLSSTCNMGFSTASGKPVIVSEKSIDAVKGLIYDEMDSNVDLIAAASDTCTSDGSFQDFTNDEEQIQCSKVVLEFADQTGLQQEQYINSSAPTCTCTYTCTCSVASVGFSTASGRPVNISKESLQAVQRLTCDEDLSVTNSTARTTAAAAKCRRVSEELDNNVRHVSRQTAFGFFTASGKPVNISEESLRAVKGEDIECNQQLSNIGFSTASGKPVGVSEESLRAVKGLINEDIECNQQLSNIGFSTASGKPVGVSEESLRAVKGLINEDIECNQQLSNIGFSTASGKPVGVSEESLRAVKGLINEDIECNQQLSNIGFSTASGKPVGVSEESLRAVKGLINEDIECNQQLSNIGFSTASGKPVGVSEESLRAVKGLINEDIECNQQLSNIGFSTASGKPVGVSEESLRAVKGLINEDNECNQQLSNIGFSTASGKPVGVSEESLRAVKGLINEDIECNQQLSNIGFSTASGKPVNISEESLRAVKGLINDKDSDVNRVTLCSQTENASLQPVNGGERGRSKEGNIFDACSFSKQPVCEDDSPVNPLPVNPSPTTGMSTLCNDQPDNRQPQIISKRHSFVCTPEGILCDRHVRRALIPKPFNSFSTDVTTKKRSIQWSKSRTPFSKKKIKFDEESNCEYPEDACKMTKGTTEVGITQLSPPLLTNSQMELFEDTTLTQQSLGDQTSVSSPDKIAPVSGTILACRRIQNFQRTSLHRLGERLERHCKKELLNMNVTENVINVSIKTALDFIFTLPFTDKNVCLSVGDGITVYGCQNDRCVGVEKLWRSFCVSPGVDKALISCEWFKNHYKWIIWKLASYEISFPKTFAGSILTIDWCMKQMKYRYDVEIDSAKRSLIHLICEGDESPACPMVMCISDIHLDNQRVELTDGWYFIPAKLDHHLSDKVRSGLIRIGYKIFICGAQMEKSNELGHPLEVSKNKCLQLFINSVRRARWNSPLGKVRLNHLPSFPLSSVYPDGGMIPSLKIIVARVFPFVYMEKLENGQKIFRTIKMEEKKMKEFEEIKNKRIHAVYERVEKECEKILEIDSSKQRRRSGRITSRSVRNLKDGEGLYNVLRGTNDPESLMRMLSPTQHALLHSYKELLIQRRQEMFQKRLSEAMEEYNEQFSPVRSTVSLLRAMIVQYGADDADSSLFQNDNNCELGIWRPPDEIQELIKDGVPLQVSYVTSTQRLHNRCLQLSCTKKSKFEKLKVTKSLLTAYHSRTYTPIDSTVLSPVCGYYDTVGRTVTIVKSQLFRGSPHDALYVTDNKHNLLKIWFWEKIELLCIESLLIQGTVLAICNLEYQRNVISSSVSEAFASNKSVFLQYPNSNYLLVPLNEMKRISKSKEMHLLEKMADVIRIL